MKTASALYLPSKSQDCIRYLSFLCNIIISLCTLEKDFFIFLSTAVFYIFIKIVSVKYRLINTLVKTTPGYTDNKETYNRKSLFVALYKKELGRFLNSYMEMLNAGFGVILLCIFSIFLLFNSVEQIGGYLGIENVNEYFSNLSPLFIAAMLVISCPAASAISLEGKNIWILQSSPVKVKTILNSKIALNLTLHMIGYIISVFVFILKLDMNFIQILNLIIVPICYSLFITVTGVALNKKYPNYEWESEMIVVKQSMPVILSGLTGIVAIIIPIFLYLVLNLMITYTLQATSIVLTVVTIVVYRKVSHSKYIFSIL